MINIKFDTRSFEKTLKNVSSYSNGFMDGIHLQKTDFNKELGIFIKNALEEYIDAKSRMSPESLHHIYEWNQVGNSSSRLFDFVVSSNNNNITFIGNFLPSKSLSGTSTEPFVNKSEVMENGITVTIEPKNAEALSFEDDGERIFTKNSITIENPGGSMVKDSFEKVVNDFFNNYLSVGLLRSSGILNKLESPIEYSKRLAEGSRSGRSVGVSAGRKYLNIGGAEIR